MKNPVQLNGDADWGNTPRQQNRFYSVYGGGICLQLNKQTQIMELYEL